MFHIPSMLAVALLAIVACGASAPVRAEDTATLEQVQSWVQDLSADEYNVRDLATRRLIAAGPVAVGPVAKALGANGLEVTTRGIFVLQELGSSGDIAAEEAARSALEKVAAVRVTAAARRARVALDKLDIVRQERTLLSFKQLGARVDKDHIEMGLSLSGIYMIEFGERWRGTEEDLAKLKWLTDVEQVSFIGPKVAETWLQHLEGMANLSIVKLKRATITDDALVHLPNSKGLQYVKLLYVPVTDNAIEHLKKCKQLSKVMLFGTEVTRDAASRLQEALVAEVDHRHGGFLGISPSQRGNNWFIQTVTPGSAAEKAGLQPGDVIVKYADQPVGDFESLTSLIAKNTAGDTVKLEVRRANSTIPIQTTLGEWD